MPEPIIVIGGGISGLSLGWKLAQHGIQVHVIESSPYVGGLAGTVREDGYSLDFGPHSFFTEDEEIKKIVLNLFETDNPLLPARRSVQFCYQGKHLDYPLTALSVLTQMGFANGLNALGSFIFSCVKPSRISAEQDDESVEDWAVRHFGSHLYQTFFKPYTEQFWKMPCRELSSQSIPTHTRLSFVKTLKFLMASRINRKNGSQLDREKLETYYPPKGYGEIAERIAQRFVALGGKIHLQSRALEIVLEGGEAQVTYVREGEEKIIRASQVVSTIPLNYLVRMIKPVAPQEIYDAAFQLDYRPLVFLGLVTERQNLLKASYIYTLDRPYNRLTEMSKFSPQTSPAGENILAVEIPCTRESGAWHASAEELFEMCLPSLERDQILVHSDVKRFLLNKAPYAYPIYKKNYARHLARVIDYVRSLGNVSLLGRTGEFKYGDADLCMRRAIDLADRLIQQLTGRKTFVYARS